MLAIACISESYSSTHDDIPITALTLAYTLVQELLPDS